MKQATKVAAVVARSIDRLSEALGLAAGIVVLLFTLLIVYEVVARKVFDAPLGFVFELSTYAVIAIVLLPLAFIQAQKRHVSIDLIVSRLSPQIGLITPPIGMDLFVIKGICDVSMGDIIRGAVPFAIAMAITLALTMAFPQLALWIPSLLA